MTLLDLPRGTALPEPRRPGGPDAPVVLTVAAVVCLPVLTPLGPANTAPVDGLILLALASAVVWFPVRRQLVVFPHAAAGVLLVVGGGAAALARDRAGSSGVVLVQDVFLLLWAALLATLALQPATARLVLRAWAWAASLSAALLVVGAVAGVGALTGMTADSPRAAGSFGHPNIAGSYYAVSLFVVLGARCPTSRLLRGTACTLLLFATFLTGSNSAILGIVLGAALGGGAAAVHRYGAPAVTCALCTAVAVGALVLPRVDLEQLRDRAVESSTLLSTSVGRAAEGGEERGLLLEENLDLYRRSDLFGLGPAGTKAALAREQAPYAKEAHNDYLAAVVERGALGAIGLLVLLVVLGTRTVLLLARRTSVAWRHALPRPELLAGGLVAVVVMAFFHEVLHFRHIWALLGLAAAVPAAASTTQHLGGKTCMQWSPAQPASSGRTCAPSCSSPGTPCSGSTPSRPTTTGR